MAKMPWLKLYTEIRTDPKMQALNDLEFRTWINILCLSAESKVRGTICIEEGLAYPVEGLARALFISTEELTSCFSKFQKLRMIDIDQDGIIKVTHFDDRQYDKPSDKPEEVAKRVRKHQAKKSNADITPMKREENANVTLVKRQENAIEEDEDKEGDKDIDNIIIINAREANVNDSPENENDAEENVTEKEHIANDLDETVSQAGEKRPKDIGTRAVIWAEQKWGRTISPVEAEDIIAWCDKFSSSGSPDPDGLVIEALNECDAAGPEKRNRKYLGGILARWRDAGFLTVDHVKKHEAERKSQKGNKRGNKDPGDKTPRPPKPEKYEKFYL